MNRTPSPAGCEHCGLRLPGKSTGSGRFCCSGCYVAHGLTLRDPEGRTDRLLARVVLSAFLSMGVMVFSLSLYGSYLGGGPEAQGEAAEALQGVFRLGALALSLPVLLLLGLPILDAVRGMRRWFSADSLVLLGVSAAWAVSVWNTFRGGGHVYYETATIVLLLFGLGRWLDTRARERATGVLRAVIPERERPAVLVEGTGERELPIGSLERGDLVRVRAGEVVPVDGVVTLGRSFLDGSALTGEEQPRSVGAGDGVLAGSRLVDGTLVVRAEAVGGERLRDGIERLLEEALTRRGHHVRMADRLAGALVPLALFVAVATAVLRWNTQGPEKALLDALSVVLISCPCALGIATPLAFWAALGAAWRDGVLVRGGEVLERLARVRRVWFDKTGTLTSGELRLTGVRAAGELGPERALSIAGALEAGSDHPIARALRRESVPVAYDVEDFRDLPGIGVEGVIDGVPWRLRSSGSSDSVLAGQEAAAVVELVRREEPVASFELRADLRAEVPAVLRRLQARGLDTRVLTGDGPGPARALEAELGIPVVHGLDPVDKVERVRGAGTGSVFVGDGLNDAAALAAADVGVSMMHASARSLDAAEVNLLRDGVGSLPGLLDRARSAVLAARVNLAWAFGYNAIGMGLAATGRLSPIFAAAAMVLSSLAVVLNTSRLVRAREEREPRPYAQGRSERTDSCPQPA